MKTLKIITGILLVVILAAERSIAQDPVFSQYYNAPVYLNPALIGDEEEMLFNLNYRSQWKTLHQPYRTGQASFIYPFYSSIHKDPVDHVGGMGVSVFNDVSGFNNNFKTTGGNVSFAYNLQLQSTNINRISFGIQVGVINNRIDTEGFQWGQQYDPETGGYNPGKVPAELSQFESSTVLDITPGVFWRFYNQNRSSIIASAFSGIAVSHLNRPNESNLQNEEDRLPLLYKYHGGVVFALSEKANVSANILTLFQDKENQTNLGAFFSYLLPFQGDGIFSNSISRIGTWYRASDSFILSTEFVTNSFLLGFSYDWNVSDLNNFDSGIGAYEISLGLRFNRIAPPKVRY